MTAVVSQRIRLCAPYCNLYLLEDVNERLYSVVWPDSNRLTCFAFFGSQLSGGSRRATICTAQDAPRLVPHTIKIKALIYLL